MQFCDMGRLYTMATGSCKCAPHLYYAELWHNYVYMQGLVSQARLSHIKWEDLVTCVCSRQLQKSCKGQLYLSTSIPNIVNVSACLDFATKMVTQHSYSTKQWAKVAWSLRIKEKILWISRRKGALLCFPSTNFANLCLCYIWLIVYPWSSIGSNMTPEQRHREKIASIQVPAAAFRPDRVSIFSIVVRIQWYITCMHAQFVVCDTTKNNTSLV